MSVEGVSVFFLFWLFFNFWDLMENLLNEVMFLGWRWDYMIIIIIKIGY